MTISAAQLADEAASALSAILDGRVESFREGDDQAKTLDILKLQQLVERQELLEARKTPVQRLQRLVD